MDKNNRKLKLLYKYIQANTSAICQHMLHIPPTKVHISQPLKKTTTTKPQTRATQKSLQFGKWRLRKKKSGEWAQNRNRSDSKSNRTREKNKTGDMEKWDQTESLEIPDRGETS